MSLEQEARQKLIARTTECWSRARELWPAFTAPLPEIVFFVNRNQLGLCWGHRKIGYNLGYAVQTNHVAEQTVPHEVAHAVANFFGWDRTLTGRRAPHGAQWKRVCVMLGGNGRRCSMESGQGLEKPSGVRAVTQYEYRATCGTVIMVSAIRHGKIQRGGSYVLQRTGGRVARDGFTGQAQRR